MYQGERSSYAKTKLLDPSVWDWTAAIVTVGIC
jgi:hypothetical protein